MYRIAIELPFRVLIVHRKSFTSEASAQRFIKRHYSRFPALTVYPDAHVNEWNGTVFIFPARKEKR